MNKFIDKLITFFSLFGSLGTLLCCALPVVLVTFGLGATFASLTASFQQIIWMVERKDTLFIVTFFLLILSLYFIIKANRQACPIDPKQRELCEKSKKISWRVYIFTLIIYIIGFIFSYIIPLFY